MRQSMVSIWMPQAVGATEAMYHQSGQTRETVRWRQTGEGGLVCRLALILSDWR